MKIIVGLGNPGSNYSKTFHNLGFMTVDKAVDLLGLKFEKEKFRSLTCETSVCGEKILFMKPQTFMNLSGEAVAEAVNFYKLPLNNLIVAYDDVDLPAGNVRIREKGSAGTHNGMRNIVKELGNGDFPRVRIGFRPADFGRVPLIDLVLSGIKKEDEELFGNSTQNGAKALVDFAKGVGFSEIMQKYNSGKGL